jgi:hypothetical protein
MNILLNDAVTLSADANGGNFIITGITGLGAADIRTSSFLFSGRHGGMVTDQLLGFRNLSVTGKIGNNSGTRLQHQLDRQALLDSMPIGTTFPIYITTFAGLTYRIDVNLIDLKLEYNRRGYMSDFLIQLTAGDPYFYSTDGGDEQTANVSRIQEGGYITPYILPVIWETGGSPTIVTNSGDANYYPVITLSDEALNPVITNLATGESFGLDLSMLAGDEVIIDMYNRTVTLNGADILGNKTDDSVWWALFPGDNPIMLETDTADDPITAVITWRNGVTGI